MLSKLVLRQHRAGAEEPEVPGGNAPIPTYGLPHQTRLLCPMEQFSLRAR